LSAAAWRTIALLWLAVAVTVVGLFSFATEARDNQLESCERGNDSRVSTYTNDRDQADYLFALAGQEHDPEIEAIYRNRAKEIDLKADAALQQAEQRFGYLPNPLVPAGDCDATIGNGLLP
jgi:hypothetical protein